MSAVINGRRYDTHTAGLIGLNAAGDGLYKKRTGEYFVARAIPRNDGLPARGNANRYIVPLGLSAARDWARQNLPPAIVEQEFPDAPGPRPPAGAWPGFGGKNTLPAPSGLGRLRAQRALAAACGRACRTSW